MELYSYFRASSAYRVRIALNYKNLACSIIPVNLRDGEQHGTYRQVNVQKRVPTLVDTGTKISQSLAILEYLEEKYPSPSLLPQDINNRAWVRYLAQIIICDVHPLNNQSVIKFLQNPLGLDKDKVTTWMHHWMKLGFDTLEELLRQNEDCKTFCYGNTPTFADLALVPQIYNAKRFKFPLANYKTLERINDHCMSLSYFKIASPENQPDYGLCE